MPFQDEASKFVALTKKYISGDDHKELIIKLDEELGQKTSVPALKHFFNMARLIVDPPFIPAPWYWWAALYALVSSHLALVLGVILSFFLLPFYAPWYVALPLMAFIWFFSTTSVECKLTQLENYIRKRLGLKRIGGFVGHYLVRPSRRLVRRAAGMKAPPLRLWSKPSRPSKPSESTPARN